MASPSTETSIRYRRLGEGAQGHAPTGRCSSVAVAEPVDDESVMAVGKRNRDTALVIHGPGNDGYQDRVKRPPLLNHFPLRT